MKITDLNGFEIEVTDLKGAIRQARELKDLRHVPPHPSDNQRQEYWKDLHRKLLALKTKNNGLRK